MDSMVFQFNGDNSYIEFPHPLPSIRESITIEFWAKAGDKLPCQNSLINARDQHNRPVFNIHLPWETGNVHWQAGGVNSPQQIYKYLSPEEYKELWLHWAFVKSVAEGKMEIYRNGALWHQQLNLTTPIEPVHKFCIGAYADGLGSGNWHGSLTEFRIWDQALSVEQIKQQMSRRLKGDEAGLVGYWPCHQFFWEESDFIQVESQTIPSSNPTDHGEEPFDQETGIAGVSADPLNEANDYAELPSTILCAPGQTVDPNNSETSDTPSEDAVDTLIGRSHGGNEIDLRVPFEEPASVAFELDGSGEYIELSHPLPSIENEITIEFWALGGPGLPKQSSLIEARDQNNIRAFNIHLPWGNSYLYWQAGGVGASEYIVKYIHPAEYKDIWVHWAFVKDVSSGKMNIYYNGTLWHHGENKKVPIESVHHFCIGAYADGSGGYNWNGLLSEFRIWNRALTAQQIKNRMHKRVTGKETGLVFCYPFNQLQNKAATIPETSNFMGNFHGGKITGLELPFFDQKEFFAFQFDGISNRIEFPYVLPTIENEITLEFWSKGGARLPASGVVIDFRDKLNRSTFIISFPWSDGHIYWDAGLNTENRIQKAATVQEYRGSWKHWAFVKNATTGKMAIYQNGVVWQEANNMKRSFEKAIRFTIGSYGDLERNYKWHGLISELRIWDQARSVEEIKSHMNQRLTGKEEGLLVYLPFNKSHRGKTLEMKIKDVSNHVPDVFMHNIQVVNDPTLPTLFSPDRFTHLGDEEDRQHIWDQSGMSVW